MTQAEELLKEAIAILEEEKERINHVQEIDKAIDKINAYLKSQESSVVNEGVMSWEKALEIIWKRANSSQGGEWNDFSRETWMNMGNEVREAAHLFMEANRQQRWIPVEENSMPDFDTPVLVWCRIWGRYIGSYNRIHDTNWGNWHDGKELGVLPPTLWQPLPEIPKEFKG